MECLNLLMFFLSFFIHVEFVLLPQVMQQQTLGELGISTAI